MRAVWAPDTVPLRSPIGPPCRGRCPRPAPQLSHLLPVYHYVSPVWQLISRYHCVTVWSLFPPSGLACLIATEWNTWRTKPTDGFRSWLVRAGALDSGSSAPTSQAETLRSLFDKTFEGFRPSWLWTQPFKRWAPPGITLAATEKLDACTLGWPWSRSRFRQQERLEPANRLALLRLGKDCSTMLAGLQIAPAGFGLDSSQPRGVAWP